MQLGSPEPITSVPGLVVQAGYAATSALIRHPLQHMLATHLEVMRLRGLSA